MRFIFLLLPIFLVSCVNNYEKFYTSTGVNISHPRVLVTNEEPEILRIDQASVEASMNQLSENGYMQIGYSSFNSAEANDNNLIAFAKKIKATKVLLYKNYTNTMSGSMPLTLPNTQTSYHSGNVNAYGYGGSSFGSYSGTSTTYGTQTTYIPYNTRRYDHGAAYFVKRKPGGLGVGFRDLTVEERQSLDSNFGAAITIVVKGSSAFKNNMMAGDLVTKIDGQEVQDGNHFAEIIKTKYGKNTVHFTLYRSGKMKDLTMDIDPEFKE